MGRRIGLPGLTIIFTPILMPEKVFLDASYAIALASSKDIYHSRAAQLASKLQAEDAVLVTTRAVVLEIGNALSKQRYRSTAVRLLLSLEADPRVEIKLLTDPLYFRALHLFQQREDKEWGLTDCISFVVMTDERITAALTADGHFR